MSELRECPFCGGEDIDTEDLTLGAFLCNWCGAVGPVSDDYVIAWNTRATPKVKPLVWDWIGDKHAFGKCSGFSYEILYTYSIHSDIGQPPDITKPWRSKCLSFGKYVWHETAQAAQEHQQRRHDKLILEALA